MEKATYEAAARLAAAGVPEPVRDARLLARWAANMDAAGFAAARLEPMSATAAARFAAAVNARAARRPVSRIVGVKEFFGRSFRTDERALDPRPESETLITAALRRWAGSAATRPRILDLGVGSGCLLLTLLAERPDATGCGVDASADALALAAENAARLGVAAQARFRLGDWLDGVQERFDLVIANPPYIPAHEIPELAPEVRLYDPRDALTPGGDGLDAYRRIAPALGAALTPQGVGIVEFGRGQRAAVEEMFRTCGFNTSIEQDLGGVDRALIAETG